MRFGCLSTFSPIRTTLHLALHTEDEAIAFGEKDVLDGARAYEVFSYENISEVRL